MPGLIACALESEPQVLPVAERLAKSDDMLFVGRGLQYPVVMEGALKLKEVSYVHAEGYAAGELKHGPIALIDERMPVVAVVPQDDHYAKMMSNIEEIRARNGVVIAIASQGDAAVHEKAQYVLQIPDAPLLLQPMVASIPLQLLAYHIGLLRGCDIDQPRNLAKTVTVE
jgi:glucosamine--fructose-6-phosphate aminotransferase (isomerizing)